MICGIYHICNKINGKVYIGSSRNIFKRFARHRDELKRNVHHSSKLQNSWNKHGKSAFVFEVIELCEEEKLIKIEQVWIDRLNSFKNGYNNRPFAENQKGLSPSAETREKIAATKRGIPLTAEHKAKLSIAGKGRKSAKGMLGKKHSEKTKAKMSLSAKGNKANTGRKFSAEHIAKIVASRLATIAKNRSV